MIWIGTKKQNLKWNLYKHNKGIKPLRITACGGYIGCYGGLRDPEPDPYPGCGQTYYRYILITDSCG